MVGHTIVSGADALAVRIAEELRGTGTTVTVIDRADELTAAGISTAAAVVCVGDDDALNLEIALLARQYSPTVRVVARLANGVLREAMAVDNGPGAVLDVADLAAPSVVEACLARTTHTIATGGLEFVVSGADAPRTGTLREIYGDLAPVAVLHGDHSATPGAVVACPGRDVMVDEGDWVAMIGTADELAAEGIAVAARATVTAGSHRGPVTRLVNAARAFREDVNPNFYRALSVSLSLLAFSTVLLWFTYDKPGMSLIDALYFSTETIATVGYGDFSFSDQPTWLRLFSIVLMFAGITTTAVLMAFIADLLLSRRLAYSAGRRKVRELRDHMIVVGLGSFGIRVAADLKAAGHDVAVVELNIDNRYLSAAADLDIPVIFGDATLPSTLEAARIDDAVAVAVLTDNDMVNIETGIVSRERLKARWTNSSRHPRVPVVLRVFDRVLGAAVAQRFGFENVRSTVELAAPWYIGAALGLTVFGTFSVGQASFMVGGVQVEPGSELDGIRMAELSTQARVIAIVGRTGVRELHPRRGSQLNAGDTAYLVGPYRELLDTLRKGRSASFRSPAQ
ncbi:K+ transport system, NAD-binding component [Mycolicibacterium chubuense NBB4]|uniref:K+ transport system, NAD-binding component n=1 Tax=Mycolicibacterium chubuense (strain NBB4) TaxID=710421 RepID=I4BMM3_MYCCN|nr:NAD-binding protein [Mycolicibacterium chubuense]AFM18530.1 K+ transport system, NAD-binding component [Mycolicibacterium chubuense NBB4]